GKWSYSAERGYMREASNLVFHLSLVGVLVTILIGRLVYYEGQVIVIAGTESQSSQVCNTAVANFDSFRNGPAFDGTTLNPFCVNVKNSEATYEPTGQATNFTSDIDWAKGQDALNPVEDWEHTQLRVNHPLNVDGDL